MRLPNRRRAKVLPALEQRAGSHASENRRCPHAGTYHDFGHAEETSRNKQNGCDLNQVGS